LSDNFKLGADASVAAGPVGRSASADTDLKLNAEILSYSRSRGIFAGVSLSGSVIKIDKSADDALYGPTADRHNILDGSLKSPAGTRSLQAELDRYAR
jgi:lipid-binding SYLF domain-containing protein